MGYYEKRLVSLTNQITALTKKHENHHIIILSIKSVIDDLRVEFGSDKEVMKHVKKLMDLLKGLV